MVGRQVRGVGGLGQPRQQGGTSGCHRARSRPASVRAAPVTARSSSPDTWRRALDRRRRGRDAVQSERRPLHQLRTGGLGDQRQPVADGDLAGLERGRDQPGRGRDPADVAGHGQDEAEAAFAEAAQRGQRPAQRAASVVSGGR